MEKKTHGKGRHGHGAASSGIGQKSVCTLATYQQPAVSRAVSPPVAYFFLPAQGRHNRSRVARSWECTGRPFASKEVETLCSQS